MPMAALAMIGFVVVVRSVRLLRIVRKIGVDRRAKVRGRISHKWAL